MTWYDTLPWSVAILSKTPIKAREQYQVDDQRGLPPRRVAPARGAEVESKELAAASVHLSWWDKVSKKNGTIWGYTEGWATSQF